MKRILKLTAAFYLAGAVAAVALTADELVTSLSAEGYTRIEVTNGLTQIKVEAIRGTEKLEVIYDIATGAVIKREVETVRAGENTAPGVHIRNRSRDFVGASGGNGGNGGGVPPVDPSTGLAPSPDALVAALTAEGYTRIEVTTGLTQLKVEAIRGTEKLEVIYDIASGAVLKREVGAVEPGDDILPGIQIRVRARDFLGSDGDDRGRGRGRGGNDDDDDDSDDDEDDDDDDDEDEDDNSGSNSGKG